MSDHLRLARLLDDDSEGDSALSPLCKAIVNGEHQAVRPKRDDRGERVDLAALVTRVAKLEAAAKRKPSRNKKMTQSDMETLADAIGKCLGQELQPLQKRIEELEQRAELKWAGVWHQDMRCNEGELITDRGSLWVCTAPSSDRPGDNASAFRLIVKNGSHNDNGSRRHVTTGTRN